MTMIDKMILRQAIPSWQNAFGWPWFHTARHLIRRRRWGQMV